MSSATQTTPPAQTADSDLVAAVEAWSPSCGPRPDVEVEPRPDGLRVKLTYLGVESGLLFAAGPRVNPPAVHAELDRVFEVLSWRVISPPTS